MTPPQKKVKLTPEEEKTSANFDKIVKIQDQVTQLEDELEKEIALLQDKYDKLKKPLFDARRQITATIPEFWAEAVSIANKSSCWRLLDYESSSSLGHGCW